MSKERQLSIKKELVRTETTEEQLFEKRILNIFDVKENFGKTLKSKYENVPKVINSLDILPEIDTIDLSDTKGENIFKQTATKSTQMETQPTFHSNVLHNSGWGNKNFMHHETRLDNERQPIRKKIKRRLN